MRKFSGDSITVINSISRADIDAQEVDSIWKGITEKTPFRLLSWRLELKRLAKEMGLTIAGVAEQMGEDFSNTPGFFEKLPKKRETYVKLGLILKQPRSVVDRWIKKNTKTRGLYAKDPSDLIGIYFLDLSFEEKHKNYCNTYTFCLGKSKKEFEEFKEELNFLRKTIKDLKRKESKVEEIEKATVKKQLDDAVKRLDEMESVLLKPASTIEVEKGLIIREDNCEDLLTEYMVTNYQSFQVAHEKPRQYINEYIDLLIDRLEKTKRAHELSWSRVALKKANIITDAMYNYICGDIDKAQVPRKKSSYISYGLHLGMSMKQINTLLNVAGYDCLNINDDSDGYAEFVMIPLLIKWEESHELANKWRRKYIDKEPVNMTLIEERIAIEQLIGGRNLCGTSERLGMREDLINEFNKSHGIGMFPF